MSCSACGRTSPESGKYPGRLTGKYPAESPPPTQHDDRTPSQVALNGLIAEGAVPIPGAEDRKQAEENAGALGGTRSLQNRSRHPG